MNHKSRTYNTVKNASISTLIQLLTLIASFVSRTIFIKVLGDQYLGISGLYSNILSVLSLADLGITTVMTFSLYKPIAEHDTEKVSSLLAYFKKIYRYIALAVFAVGMCLVPFLNLIINGSELPLSELRLYYILFLFESACSYLVVYKTTLIQADQKIFVIKIANFIGRMVSEAAIITVLLLTGNYLLFLVINVAVTLAKNLVLSVTADKMYPFLREKAKPLAQGDQKKQIVDNIKSLFIYRVSAMIMNSTDNIIISVMLGTVIVGYYSNYLVVITALNTFILLFAQAVLSSIGNFNASAEPQKKLLLFRSLLLGFAVIGAVCVCCFQTMFNDFIYLWIGKQNPSYILRATDVACISVNFFVSCLLNPIWMYREATGIFKKTRYSMTCAAVLNILLSVVLGRQLGLGGIIVATGLAKLLTNFWFEPIVLYRDIFESKVKNYWGYMGKLLAVVAGCIAVSILACAKIPCGWGWMFLKILISFLVCGLLFLLAFARSEEFAFYKNKLLSLISGKVKKQS